MRGIMPLCWGEPGTVVVARPCVYTRILTLMWQEVSMKGASNGWDRLLSLAERLPLARHLPEGPRRGAAYGIWAGGLLMFVVGALLGGVNRGAAGLVIAAISGACLGMILGGGLGSLFGALFTAPTARATVSIEFDGGKKTFRPGETLSGAVELHAQSGFKCGGRACFMCRGHYAHNRARPDRTAAPEFVRESRQYLLQQEQVIPAGRMRQGSRARYPFSFTVPSDAIPTHHGYACSVRWTVNALIDAITESPLEAREEVFVESVAQPAPSPQGGYESRAEAEHCQVTLALPRAICAEGDTLHGHIVVVPKNSFDSPQIRALLLRIEHNPKGDGDIVYVGQWDAKTGQFQGERR
ncbi:MAG: hypothetical protein FJZ90_06005, partial [Chloroflexi bacterium]|nr:hypothetical protein [Chloroflexota bacterium]